MRTPKGHIPPKKYLQTGEPINKYDIKEYKKTLSLISKTRLNIHDIACLTGKSYGYTSLRMKLLVERGYIKKVFVGQQRVIILTEEGRRLIEGERV